MKPIYVFGHRHPDNDSIVSAVAYAALKNQIDSDNTYVAARLGPMPRETQWLFDQYDIETPELIDHINTRVSDVMQPRVISVSPTTEMGTASRVMMDKGLRVLPIIDEDNRAVGLLSHRTLAQFYLDEIINHSDSMTGNFNDKEIASIPDLYETALEFTSPETLLADAANSLLSNRDRELLVTDEEGCVVGIITRSDVVRGEKRRAILVDHNESSQSAPGVHDADVIEIIDHHRVGDIQTSGPILFHNMPLGSTASIVALRYREAGVEIPLPIAAILLSAILTDTVILKSPTTTQTDRELVEQLAEVVGVDYEEFGLSVLKARRDGVELDVTDILDTDLKEYLTRHGSVAIVQFETVDIGPLKALHDEVLATMNNIATARAYDIFILLATDIIAEGSEVFVVGDVEVAEKALDIELSGGSAWMPGVLSRKKQIAPAFMD